MCALQHELGSVERANFLKKYSEIKLNEQLSPRAEEEKAGILRSVSTPYLFLDQKINLQKQTFHQFRHQKFPSLTEQLYNILGKHEFMQKDFKSFKQNKMGQISNPIFLRISQSNLVGIWTPCPRDEGQTAFLEHWSSRSLNLILSICCFFNPVEAQTVTFPGKSQSC